jgi:hypothetical protein
MRSTDSSPAAVPLKGQLLFICAERWFSSHAPHVWGESAASSLRVFRSPSEAHSALGHTRFRLAVVVIDDLLVQAGHPDSVLPKGRGRIPVFYLRVSDDMDPVRSIVAQANAVIVIPSHGPDTFESFVDLFVSPDSNSRFDSIRISPEVNEFPQRLSKAREIFEKAFLLESFRIHGGNVSRTAKALGITRRSLQIRLRKCGLPALDSSPKLIRDADASHATSAPSS